MRTVSHVLLRLLDLRDRGDSSFVIASSKLLRAEFLPTPPLESVRICETPLTQAPSASLAAGRAAAALRGLPQQPRQDCHFAGMPSPTTLKPPLKGEGGAAD